MFTGIIEDIGRVTNITDSKIVIETRLNDIKTGDSIAVNGTCLTVTKIENENLSFDYSPTTSGITNISLLKKDSIVNLERALTLQTRLGGHIVSGHIDTATKIVDIKKLENNQTEIQLNKTVSQVLPQGTNLRLHAAGISNVNIETKTIQPGKEEVLSGSLLKDNAFIEKYSKVFGKDLFYCKPLIIAESLDANEDINILVSDFVINY